MERATPQRLTAVEHHSEALVFDHQRRNRRHAFVLQQTLQAQADGSWQLQRHWHAVGLETVASEAIVWRDGLVESRSTQPFIDEVTRAMPKAPGCVCTLRSPRTGGPDRERLLELPHAAVTPASLRLFIAQHWATLSQGARLPASYLVLKVQRAATVHLQRAVAADGSELVIAATPANPLLRWIFGSTRCVFNADAPRLRRMEGLLDPRDVKPNGRWLETLGTIEFTQPLDLSALAAQGTPR